MTIKQFAEKKGVPVATVYSWIYRSQAEKNGFTTKQFGSVTMVEEIRVKKKIIT
jgi:hypothetical protein